MKDEKDWKLKLRYEKDSTPYSHFTVLAEGVVVELVDGFECPPGNAIMGMKAWAINSDETVDMIKSIGLEIGFTVDGEIQIYGAEPEQSPQENPYGYDIQFTPFD